MQKTWYFKYKSQYVCVKYTKKQYWFFLGRKKSKDVWYGYKPHLQYDVIEYFEKTFGRIKYYDKI